MTEVNRRIGVVSLFCTLTGVWNAHAQGPTPNVTLSMVPIGGHVVQPGSVVAIEVFVTVDGDSCPGAVTPTNPNGVRFEGGQIDLPCTLSGGDSGRISIVDPGGPGGGTSDPDGDGLRGPSFMGIPPLFGGGGIAAFQGLQCLMAFTPALGASPRNVDVGQTRYLGTFFYQVSGDARGEFSIDFEGVTRPSANTNTTRWRDDCPAWIGAGVLLELALPGTTLTVASGRCCGDSRCLGIVPEHQCTEIEGGSWSPDERCDGCPCQSEIDCDDGNVCTVESCTDGLCTSTSASVGMLCGFDVESPCDDFDACDGEGHCLPGIELDGTPCRNVGCIPDGICFDGRCAGSPINCDDRNKCTYDTCSAGECVHTPVPAGSVCGDRSESECDNPDSCDSQGQCLSNPRPDGTVCTADSNPCTLDQCLGGRCAHPPAEEGTPCGNPRETPCDHADTCDRNGICQNNWVPIGESCDDGRYCNGRERCRFGSCVRGPGPCGACEACDEVNGTCEGCSQWAMVESVPPCGDTLWRIGRNVVRMKFEGRVGIPDIEALEIVELNADGATGPNLNGLHQFRFELSPDGTELSIIDHERHFKHGTWYGIFNAGSWLGVAPFKLDLLVQVGDANGDGRVLGDDASLVNDAVPCWNCPQDRRDVSGDQRVTAHDVSIVNSKIPSAPVAKPSGHSCAP